MSFRIEKLKEAIESKPDQVDEMLKLLDNFQTSGEDGELWYPPDVAGALVEKLYHIVNGYGIDENTEYGESAIIERLELNYEEDWFYPKEVDNEDMFLRVQV